MALHVLFQVGDALVNPAVLNLVIWKISELAVFVKGWLEAFTNNGVFWWLCGLVDSINNVVGTGWQQVAKLFSLILHQGFVATKSMEVEDVHNEL